MINMQAQSEEQMHHKHVHLLVSQCGVNGGLGTKLGTRATVIHCGDVTQRGTCIKYIQGTDRASSSGPQIAMDCSDKPPINSQ